MEAKMDATIRTILEGYFGEGSVDDVIDDLHREIYKAGIREVVEWILRQDKSVNYPLQGGWLIISPEDKAKLKGWGIKEDK